MQCVCPSIDRTHATHARLSCCKSSPDIRAHGDLQYSVAVIDDRCVWQFSVWGRRADSDSANHTHISCVCVSVRVHLHDCDADFSRLICAQGAKCSCLFGAVYFTKCSV